MASEIAVAIIGGVTGLVTGTAGSLTAPWAQWGVEQRRLRRQRRVDLITNGAPALMRCAQPRMRRYRTYRSQEGQGNRAGTWSSARMHLIRPRRATRNRIGTKP